MYMKVALWLRGGARVRVPVCGQGFVWFKQITSAKGGSPGFRISLSRREAKGKEGVVRVKSYQLSNIKKIESDSY